EHRMEEGEFATQDKPLIEGSAEPLACANAGATSRSRIASDASHPVNNLRLSSPLGFSDDLVEPGRELSALRLICRFGTPDVVLGDILKLIVWEETQSRSRS